MTNPQLDYKAAKKDMNTLKDRLIKIGIDVSLIEDEIQKIEKEIEREQESNCFNENSYIKYYEKLNKLKSDILAEWEIYFEIDKMASSLNISLYDDTNNNTKECEAQIKEILNLLLKTTKVNTSDKEAKIEMAYEVVYGLLKLEALYAKGDNILKEVKRNPVHMAYITELINKDINMLSTAREKSVLEVQYGVEKKGLDNNVLLDQKLIRTLAQKTNDQFTKKRRENINKKLDEYQKMQKELETARTITEVAKEEYEGKKSFANAALIDVIKRFAYIAINGALLGTLTLGSYKVIKNLSTQYPAVSTTYDSGTGTTKKERIYENRKIDDYIIIKEYSPWELLHNSIYYERKVITRYVKVNEELELPDYISQIENYIELSHFENREITTEKPEDFGNRETTYSVSYIAIGDEAEYTNEGETAALGASAVALFVSAIIEIAIAFNKLDCSTEFLISYYIEKSKETKPSKDELKEKTKDLNKLLVQCKTLLNQIQKDPNYCLLSPDMLDAKKEEEIKVKEEKEEEGKVLSKV